MIHPDTELRPAGHDVGLGVFATRFLPRGTITWALDALDQRITTPKLLRLGPLYRPVIDRYAYLNGHGDRILCWDIGRFMNHACDANSISTGWDFDIAIRDIEAGEQITNDYTLLNLDNSFDCACGSVHCRGVVTSLPADWEALTPGLDVKVRLACADAGKVEQALWPWVANKPAIEAAFRDPQNTPSVAEHRFDAQRPGLEAVVASGHR